MSTSIRPAAVADIPHLAHALMEASGGLVEAVYDGVIPGRSANVIVEHLFSRSGATTAFSNCMVAENDESVLGSVHAFPMDAMGDGPPDPLAPDDRLYVYAPFMAMHADGSYYVMALAVYPEFQGAGVGKRLMAEVEAAAKTKGFKEMSLNVFAENRGAVRLYQSLGYKESARAPAVAHEKIRYGGDILLMTRAL
ncbi:MAG: GNAT family N-acetyltransferase [Pseudomonadota bacterium]